MKNIHKIIESPTEIMDKCAWWYNTITGETLRWNGTIWEAISQGGSSPGGGSSQLEAGEGITIENNTISTNTGGDIVVNSNNNLSIWQIPGVKRVRFLNKGRVDLNRKYEIGLIPPSTKSRFIRFIHTDIASHYTEIVNIPGRHGIYDASSQLLKRQDLVNKTQVFLNDNLVQFDIQYKLKSHNNTNEAGRRVTPHRVSPENSPWDDSGLMVFSLDYTDAQFKAIPYIVILNPFIEYGGKLIYKYEVVNGNYIIKVKTEDIKHKEVLFDTKGQQYLEFQEAQQGKISCTKGSFTPKKYLYTYRNKVSNNVNFQQLFTHRKAKVIKYSNNEYQFSYEKVLDYVNFLYVFENAQWRKHYRRKIIVMCIDKLAKHKFSGLEEREVWVDKNLYKLSGKPGKVGHKVFRIQ